MPSFSYTARNNRGSVQVGQLDALSEDEVVAILQNRGLFVTSITQKDVARLSSSSGHAVSFKGTAARRRMHTGVKTDDQVLLCQQLATLVDAGVPLLKSLQVVSAQVESRMLLLALEEARRDVEAGSTFKDALAKHPKVFSNLWINLVGTGEAGGHLAQSLHQLAHHFEATQHLQNEIKTAMTYPVVLVIAAIAVLGVFMYWIIPKFAGMFATMDMELPLLTKFMLGLSHAVQKYAVAIAMGGAVLVYVARRYLQTEGGRWLTDRLVLQLPGFKNLFTAVQLAEFSQGLATLLDSGVPLLSCLEILENSATNKVYGRAIGLIREAVKEGKPMGVTMGESGLFPPMTVQMTMVGEEVGELAKMVSRIATYYGERVETFIARMTRLFEPVAIIFMGGIVLVIVLSIFLPIFQMAGGGGKM